MLNIKRQLPEKVLGCTCTRLVAEHRHDRKTMGILSICCACAVPEGGQGVRTPLKNHKNIGFLSNTGLDPLKITKLPSQHSMSGHHRPTS